MSRILSKLGDRAFNVAFPTTLTPRNDIRQPVILHDVPQPEDNHVSIEGLSSATEKMADRITVNDKTTDLSLNQVLRNDPDSTDLPPLMSGNTTSWTAISELKGLPTTAKTIFLKDPLISGTIQHSSAADWSTTASKRHSTVTPVLSGLNDRANNADKMESNVTINDVGTVGNLSSSNNNRLGLVDRVWPRKSSSNISSVNIDLLSKQLPGGNTISTGQPDVADGLHVGAHVSGLISGEIIAISIGCILAFWLIVGPIVYVLIRLRNGGKSSARKRGERDDELSPALLEEIIRDELAKGRAKLYRTSIEDNRELEKFTLDDCGRRDGRFEMKFATSADLAGVLHGRFNAGGYVDSPLKDSLRRIMLPMVRNGIRSLDKVIVRNSFDMSTRTPENERKLHHCATGNYNNGAFVGTQPRKGANSGGNYLRGNQTLEAVQRAPENTGFWNAAQSLCSPTADELKFTGSCSAGHLIPTSRSARHSDENVSLRYLLTASNESPRMNTNCDVSDMTSSNRNDRWDVAQLNTSISTGHFSSGASSRDTMSLCRTVTGSLHRSGHTTGGRHRQMPQSSTLGSICEQTPRKFPVMGCRQNSLMQGRESRDASPTGGRMLRDDERSHSDASVRRFRPTNVSTSPFATHYPLSPSASDSMRLLISPANQVPLPPSSPCDQIRFSVNATNQIRFVTSPTEGQICQGQTHQGQTSQGQTFSMPSANGHRPSVLLKNSAVETLWKFNHCVNNSTHPPIVAQRSVELLDSTV